MPTNANRALSILGAALVLGVAGELLLRATPWGINLGLWLALVLVGLAAIWRAHRLPLSGSGRWALAPALLFAFALAWRDSPALAALNILATLLLLIVAAAWSRAGDIRRAGLLEYAIDALQAGFHASYAPLALIFQDITWRRVAAEGGQRRGAAVLRGLLIALPLLLVFGGLFAAADAGFERLVSSLFNWDIEDFVEHAMLAGFCGWLVAGFLRQTLLIERWSANFSQFAPPLRLGGIEIMTVLALLNGLFAVFVLFQFRYLFGGLAELARSETLTYAEYARRGFFELVTVAALLLPLLLLLHWLLRREEPGRERGFRILAGVLLALLFMVMASALQRMWIYQQQYGLTELRIYTTAFMGWLALVGGWFAATVLRGRRERFAFGALAAGLAVIALLNLVNPDALIVRTNLARAEAQTFDARYAGSLSADAVPELIAALPDLPQEERCEMATEILSWSAPEERGKQRDWRTWNWSRSRAWDSIDDNVRGMLIPCLKK
jgi:hypothetical protein